jgi:hypothetical protein
MISCHSASVLAEAWRKGIRDFDLATAFERLKAMAAGRLRGLGEYGRLGWVRRRGESVSKTLSARRRSAPRWRALGADDERVPAAGAPERVRS